MEVRILHRFHDRVDYTKVYLVGETYTFDDTRAESLIKRGLAESAEEPNEAPAEELATVVEAEDIIEVSEVEEPTEGEVVEAGEVTETPVEEPKVAVKPVATKRKNQPKDN